MRALVLILAFYAALVGARVQGSDSCIALGSQLLESCAQQISALTPYLGKSLLPPAVEASLPDPTEACCAAAGSYVAHGSACQCSRNVLTYLLPQKGDVTAQSVSEALSLLVDACRVAAADC